MAALKAAATPPVRDLILALDLGTSSTRAALHDAGGRRRVETTAQVAYPLITGPDGRAELDPATLARAVERTARHALRAAKGQTIAAVGVSCFWHSLLGLDAGGRPLTPIYTWADSRCRHDADQLRQRPGERAIHRQTGCMARASYWPAKLLWLRRTEPGLFRRVARWVSPAEWIQLLWCGRATVSLSMASGTGLLDARTLRWHSGLLARCRIGPDQLNELSDEPAPVSASWRRRFPVLDQARWFPALGDGAAGNLGSDAMKPGRAALNVGTSAALRVVVPAASPGRATPAPFGLFDYRVDRSRRVLGGAISNAGNLRAWARRELKLPGTAAIEKQLGKRHGPAPGLTLLPFWMAERAPTWPDGLPSAVIGITQATSALDLLQALEEASYLRLAQIAREVERAAGRRLAFIVSGGIRHSADAIQRLADALDRPVSVAAEPEASLRGAACFALERLGQHPKPLALGRAIRPRPAAAKAYRQALARQVRLEKWLGQLDSE